MSTAALPTNDHVAPAENFDKGVGQAPLFDLKEMMGSGAAIKAMSGGLQAMLSADQHYGQTSDLLPFKGAPADSQKV